MGSSNSSDEPLSIGGNIKKEKQHSQLNYGNKDPRTTILWYKETFECGCFDSKKCDSCATTFCFGDLGYSFYSVENGYDAGTYCFHCIYIPVCNNSTKIITKLKAVAPLIKFNEKSYNLEIRYFCYCCYQHPHNNQYYILYKGNQCPICVDCTRIHLSLYENPNPKLKIGPWCDTIWIQEIFREEYHSSDDGFSNQNCYGCGKLFWKGDVGNGCFSYSQGLKKGIYCDSCCMVSIARLAEKIERVKIVSLELCVLQPKTIRWTSTYICYICGDKCCKYKPIYFIRYKDQDCGVCEECVTILNSCK